MLNDNSTVFEEENARKDWEEVEEMEKDPDGYKRDKNLFNSLYVYSFTADGHVCKDYSKEDTALFDSMIEESKDIIGDEIYLISYREGYPAAYTLGWVVIFDVEALFSKVFTQEESILAAVGSDNKTDVMYSFFHMLDENGIRYDHNYINMD